MHPPEDQACLNAYLSKTKCTEDYTKKKTEHITDMVARDLHPTAIVEGMGSYKLVNIACHLRHIILLLKQQGGNLPEEKLLLKVINRQRQNSLLLQQIFGLVRLMILTCIMSLTCHFTTSKWDQYKNIFTIKKCGQELQVTLIISAIERSDIWRGQEWF